MLFQFENSDVADSISFVVISLYVASVMLLTKVLYFCSNAASLLYPFLFSYSAFQNFPKSSLVGVSMMVIRFPRSSSKSFDCLFVVVVLLVLFLSPLISEESIVQGI